MYLQNQKSLITFFHSDGLNTLNIEEVDSCEGLLTLQECKNSLGQFKNNKTPGSDGFTIEFYRSFWNVIGQFMVDSFNYAFKKWVFINYSKTWSDIIDTEKKTKIKII